MKPISRIFLLGLMVSSVNSFGLQHPQATLLKAVKAAMDDEACCSGSSSHQCPGSVRRSGSRSRHVHRTMVEPSSPTTIWLGWSGSSLRCIAALLLLVTVATGLATSPVAVLAADEGSVASFKIPSGGASTLQSGRTISITRGVNLDNANFAGQDLGGVAFQQSIVRDANFNGAKLVGASFFDATLDGSSFEGADLTLANVELAQFNRANLRGAVLREMYVSGATIWDGVRSIENTDWTDTYLRADQRKYLCSHPTAKGANPRTGVDTRESLLCPS